MSILGNLEPEQIAAQLDMDMPQWVTAWANEATLRDIARGELSIEQARRRLILSHIIPIAHALACIVG